MSNLKHRVSRLSMDQRRVLAKQLRQLPHAKSSVGNKKLAALVVSDQNLELPSLKDYLQRRLPDYMQPGLIKQLDALPRLPNGKLNHSELEKINITEKAPKADTAVVRNDTERVLKEIWEKVLNFSPIGREDNFFEIGGDSILSIQIIAQARKLGIIIAADQLFQHQTISKLAAAVSLSQESSSAPLPAVVGPVPITPIQHWFFSGHQAAPQYWNQVMMFDLPADVSDNTVKEAVKLLTSRHDALRLSFQRNEDQWQMVLNDLGNKELISVIHLKPIASNNQEEFILNQLTSEQKAFKFENGLSFRGLFFQGSGKKTNPLYLIGHHLVVDAFSWRIIAEELTVILAALSSGQEVKLPNPSTPYTAYSQWVNSLAESSEIQGEIPYWTEQIQSTTEFPVDMDTPLPVSENSIELSSHQLNPVHTDSLINKIPKATNLKSNELLITALALALNEWRDVKEFCLGLEGHGRDMKGSNIDLSRTVGWLTTYYPVRIDLDSSLPLKESVVSVKNTLAKVPGSGLGYGVLRYVGKTSTLNQSPPIVFNYLGRLNSMPSGKFDEPRMLNHSTRDADSERDYNIELNAMVIDDTLNCFFSYSRDQYEESSIGSLINIFEKYLNQLIDLCTNDFQAIYDPKDFPEANLSKGDLDNLLDQL